jgi:hypothetical protein
MACPTDPIHTLFKYIRIYNDDHNNLIKDYNVFYQMIRHIISEKIISGKKPVISLIENTDWKNKLKEADFSNNNISILEDIIYDKCGLKRKNKRFSQLNFIAPALIFTMVVNVFSTFIILKRK